MSLYRYCSLEETWRYETRTELYTKTHNDIEIVEPKAYGDFYPPITVRLYSSAARRAVLPFAANLIWWATGTRWQEWTGQLLQPRIGSRKSAEPIGTLPSSRSWTLQISRPWALFQMGKQR